MTLIVLDSEAVTALSDPASNKHRRALAFIEATKGARRRRPAGRTVVPTTVRVEAGWDRSEATAAVVNRLNIHDHTLDRTTADTAASIRKSHSVSPADAHIGAVINDASDDVTVLTSDDADITAVAPGRSVRVIHL